MSMNESRGGAASTRCLVGLDRCAVLLTALSMLVGPVQGSPCPRYEIVEFIPVPSLCGSLATGISLTDANDSGVFVGRVSCPAQLSRAFRSTAEGFEILPAPFDSSAQAINQAGVIVGNTNYHLGYVTLGWYWREGVLTFIEPVAPLQWTHVVDVDEAGRVLGLGPTPESPSGVAFIFDPADESFRLIGDELPGAPYQRTFPQRFASNGAVVGNLNIDRSTEQRPFLWHPDGTGETFDPCVPDSSLGAAVATIGSGRSGEILVGSCGTSSSLRHPAIWEQGDPRMLAMRPGWTNAGVMRFADLDRLYGWRNTNRIALWDHERPFLFDDHLRDYRGLVTGQAWSAVHVDTSNRLFAMAEVDGLGDGFVIIESRPVVGDYTCDAAVDFRDLLAVLAHWGPCDPRTCAEDLNDDGWVDGTELLVVLEHWTP